MSFNNDKSLEMVAFEKATVSSLSIDLTPVIYNAVSGVNAAKIFVETNPIRYRMDGVAPDATTGLPGVSGDIIELSSKQDIINFKAIRQVASATIQVGYFKD